MALTAQQRKERRLGIGGSDIAAILGISKWATPLDIYLEKLSTEEPEDEAHSPFTEWGNRLEPVIVEKFEDLTGIRCATNLDTFIHPEYEYMRANIDAKLIGEDAILECKTAGQFAGKEWSTLGGDNIPEPYLLQCAYYAEVVGCSTVHIAVLIGGNDFRLYHYKRNTALGKLILARVKEFWENHVLKQIPPMPMNHEDAVKLWRTTESDELKIANDEILQILREIRSLRNEKKSIEAQLNLKQVELFNFMQSAEQINSQSGEALATWKMQEVKRFDAARFREEHPEMYALYVKPTNARIFRLKGEV